MPQKSLRAVGFAVGARVTFGAVSGWGPGGAREKRRSDDARGSGVGAGGATPYRAKALEWTGSALDHGGVAGFKGCRRCRRPRTGAAPVADILARTPMKCAAKCDNRCELQNSVNQWPLERALRSWDIPEEHVCSSASNSLCVLV